VFKSTGNKLSVIFLILTLLPLLVMRLVVYPVTFRTVKEEITRNLEIAAHKQAELITKWMEKCVADARSIARNPVILLSVHTDSRSEEQTGLLKYVGGNNYYTFIWEEYGHKEVMVADRKGEVRLASRNDLVGTDISAKNYFLPASGGTYFTSNIIPSDVPLESETGSHEAGVPTMFFSAPILDNSQNVAGVVVVRIDISEINAMMRNIHLGRTGETYLVNADGYMLTDSRFTEDLKKLQRIKKRSALELKVTHPETGMLTKGVGECIKGTEGFDANGYTDYRGVDVLGFWHWMPDCGWGVIAEIDVDEGYGKLFRLQNSIMFILGIVAVGVVITVFFLGKRILSPISYLAENAEKIAGGSYQTRVIYNRNDETGRLAGAINTIAEMLEKKV